MTEESEKIRWNETPRARASAYGNQYASYILRALVNWLFWGTSIFGAIPWLAGHPPWTYRGCHTLILAAISGVSIRLMLEAFPRTISITRDSIYINDSNSRSYV